MQHLLDFLSLSNANVRYVVLGVMLLGASTAVIGTFSFLQKKALVGDAIAHAVLPGICLAFLWSQYKHPLVLLVGAFISGWLSILSIDFIRTRSRIKSDTAIALVLSVFFGIGILLLTYIQSTGNAAQSGLNNFLFGQASSLLYQDVLVLSILSAVLVLIVILFFKEFKLVSFDATYATTLGIPVQAIELLLSTLTVLAIAIGIQAVGVVLMSAMLISPAAAARYWTNNLSKMIKLSALFGSLAALFGSYISFSAPKMPTGPWIIVAITLITLLSLLFAKERGIFFKWYRKWLRERSIMDENVLKIFFHLGEEENQAFVPKSIPMLQQRRYFDEKKLQESLERLQKEGKVSRNENNWILTEIGLAEAKRIAKLHRLWELYMSKFLRLPDDHLHNSAESLEHFFTPAMEAMLESDLDFPETDPHQKPIPYAIENNKE